MWGETGSHPGSEGQQGRGLVFPSGNILQLHEFVFNVQKHMFHLITLLEIYVP
jgi:hypothetical protein